MKVKLAEIVEAIKDSDQVEASPDGKKVRRTDNKALPNQKEESKGSVKKRDVKSASKND